MKYPIAYIYSIYPTVLHNVSQGNNGQYMAICILEFCGTTFYSNWMDLLRLTSRAFLSSSSFFCSFRNSWSFQVVSQSHQSEISLCQPSNRIARNHGGFMRSKAHQSSLRSKAPVQGDSRASVPSLLVSLALSLLRPGTAAKSSRAAEARPSHELSKRSKWTRLGLSGGWLAQGWVPSSAAKSLPVGVAECSSIWPGSGASSSLQQKCQHQWSGCWVRAGIWKHRCNKGLLRRLGEQLPYSNRFTPSTKIVIVESHCTYMLINWGNSCVSQEFAPSKINDSGDC